MLRNRTVTKCTCCRWDCQAVPVRAARKPLYDLSVPTLDFDEDAGDGNSRAISGNRSHMPIETPVCVRRSDHMMLASVPIRGAISKRDRFRAGHVKYVLFNLVGCLATTGRFLDQASYVMCLAAALHVGHAGRKAATVAARESVPRGCKGKRILTIGLSAAMNWLGFCYDSETSWRASPET